MALSRNKFATWILICTVFMGGAILITGSFGAFISNLDDTCFRCLCHVVGCDMSHGCTSGYCGPFNISRLYWIDAGQPTLPMDDTERAGAYEDCARSYHCSLKIIEGYLNRFGKDCNSDGVTDCYDYMMINFNGGYACREPLDRNEAGRRWLRRYEHCGDPYSQ